MTPGSAARRTARDLRGGVDGLWHQQHARWALAQILAQLVGMLAIFLLTPLQLRNMGSERYGILVILTSVASYLMFLEVGAGWALTKHLSASLGSDDAARRRFIGAAIVISLPIATIGSVVAALVAGPLVRSVFSVSPAGRDAAVFVLRSLVVFVPVALMLSVITGIARAHERFVTLAVVGALTTVSINLTWALVAGRSRDVSWVAVAQVVTMFLAAAILCFDVGRLVGRAMLPLRPTMNDILTLLRFGGWTTVSRLGFVSLTTVDSLLVAALLPVALLPGYSLPFAIASRITLFCSTAVGILMPTLSRRYARDPESAATVALRAEPLVVGLTVAAVATLGFEAEPFLTFYISESFAHSGAAAALTYLAIAFGAYGVSSLDGVSLEAAGRPHRPAIAMVAGAAVGLTGLAVLARPYGVAGAAFGVACGGLLTAVLQMRAACALHHERVLDRAKRFLRSAVPPIICAGIASVALHHVGAGGLYSTAGTAAAAGAVVLLSLRSA